MGRVLQLLKETAYVRVASPGTLSHRESVAVSLVLGACTLKASPPQEPRREDLSAIDPRIAGAFRTLTSSRALEILLVTRPERSCDPLLPGLEALGHRVVIARSNKQALENFYLQAFDLVICDHGSEGNACNEFAAHLRTLDPRQRVLLMNFAQSPF